MSKNILKGFLGGAVGGAVIDLIFITFIGPSAMFSLMGITGRINVFFSHVILGGILGILFVSILKKLPKINVWLAGILWGIFCMAIVGGIPAIFYYSGGPSFITVISAFGVWTLYGLILAAVIMK